MNLNDVFLLSPLIAITPSFASRDIFFDAFDIPFTLKISKALLRSPEDSFKAELQSLKPAPLLSLNCLIFTMSLIFFKIN